MGLLVKLKKSQQKQWEFFIQCAMESYLEGKLIALPFNKAGYGFIANHQIASWFSSFTDLNWEKPSTQIIFLVNSLATALEMGHFPPIAKLLGKEYWPHEVILQVPLQESHPLISKFQRDLSPEECEILFPGGTLKLMIPDNPIFTALAHTFPDTHDASVFMGIYAENNGQVPCVDSSRLAETYTHPNIGMILDYGTLQKGKNPKSATIIECLDDVHITIRQAGLIPTELVTAFIEKCDEEGSTHNNLTEDDMTNDEF